MADIGAIEQELFKLRNITSTFIITRGGKMVLDYQHLANFNGGNLPSLPMDWYNEITTSTTASVNKGYIVNNISQVTVTLPSTSSVGDMIGIVGKGAGGWKVQCGAGQVIHHGQLSTITAGSIQSGYFKASVMLVCITANTDWSICWNNNEVEVEVS